MKYPPRNGSKYLFTNPEKFEFGTTHLKLDADDAIDIWAKPKDNSEYDWVLIKTVKQFIESEEDEELNVIPEDDGDGDDDDEDDYEPVINRLFAWLREKITPIADANDALAQIGLDLGESFRWMPLVSSHPLLLHVTAYQRRPFIERLIVELDLLNRDMVMRMIGNIYRGKRMLKFFVEVRRVRSLYDYYRVIYSGFKSSYQAALLGRHWVIFERKNTVKFMCLAFDWLSVSDFGTEYK